MSHFSIGSTARARIIEPLPVSYPPEAVPAALSPAPSLLAQSAQSRPDEACRPIESSCPLAMPTLSELNLLYDPRHRILTQYMNPAARPSFTTKLLDDMNIALDFVSASCQGHDADSLPIRYLVLASRMRGIFNLGGDLSLFMQLIERRDQPALRRYAHACIGVQYRRAVNLDLPLCTIAVVQGDALGGGFEAALAHDIIIAERQAKFGLPEILFNLFPGMGAYSLLARRLSPAQAERMILSGKVYTADEMLALGVVDRVVDPGEGMPAITEVIRDIERSRRARLAVRQVRGMVSPVTLKELIEIVDLWVDTAMTLSAADLRKMRHLASAQDRRWSSLTAH